MMNTNLISHQTGLELEEVRTQYIEALKEREELLSAKCKVHYAIEHYKDQRDAIKALMRKKTNVDIEITTYDFNYTGNPAISDIFRKPSDNYQEQQSTYQIKESSYSGLLPHLNGINREIKEKRMLFKEISGIIDAIDLKIEALERKAIELNTPDIAQIEESSRPPEFYTKQEDSIAGPIGSVSSSPVETHEIIMKLAQHGQKFGGKKLNEDTVKAYRNVFNKNDKYKEEHGKNNYKVYALRAARCDMGYDHEDEQESFYENFKRLKSRHKIKSTEDFERYLKKNGDFTIVP
jgi:hypothetical protein